MKSASDSLLTDGRSVPAVAAGAGHTGTVTVTIPAGTPPNTYYVVTCADNAEQRRGDRRDEQLHGLQHRGHRHALISRLTSALSRNGGEGRALAQRFGGDFIGRAVTPEQRALGGLILVLPRAVGTGSVGACPAGGTRTRR